MTGTSPWPTAIAASRPRPRTRRAWSRGRAPALVVGAARCGARPRGCSARHGLPVRSRDARPREALAGGDAAALEERGVRSPRPRRRRAARRRATSWCASPGMPPTRAAASPPRDRAACRCCRELELASWPRARRWSRSPGPTARARPPPRRARCSRAAGPPTSGVRQHRPRGLRGWPRTSARRACWWPRCRSFQLETRRSPSSRASALLAQPDARPPRPPRRPGDLRGAEGRGCSRSRTTATTRCCNADDPAVTAAWPRASRAPRASTFSRRRAPVAGRRAPSSTAPATLAWRGRRRAGCSPARELRLPGPHNRHERARRAGAAALPLETRRRPRCAAVLAAFPRPRAPARAGRRGGRRALRERLQGHQRRLDAHRRCSAFAPADRADRRRPRQGTATSRPLAALAGERDRPPGAASARLPPTIARGLAGRAGRARAPTSATPCAAPGGRARAPGGARRALAGLRLVRHVPRLRGPRPPLQGGGGRAGARGGRMRRGPAPPDSLVAGHCRWC